MSEKKGLTKRTKNLIIALLLATTLISTTALASLLMTRPFGVTFTVQGKLGFGLYQDSGFTVPLTTLSLGAYSAGDTGTFTIYMKSNSTNPLDVTYWYWNMTIPEVTPNVWAIFDSNYQWDTNASGKGLGFTIGSSSTQEFYAVYIEGVWSGPPTPQASQYILGGQSNALVFHFKIRSDYSGVPVSRSMSFRFYGCSTVNG